MNPGRHATLLSMARTVCAKLEKNERLEQANASHISLHIPTMLATSILKASRGSSTTILWLCAVGVILGNTAFVVLNGLPAFLGWVSVVLSISLALPSNSVVVKWGSGFLLSLLSVLVVYECLQTLGVKKQRGGAENLAIKTPEEVWSDRPSKTVPQTGPIIGTTKKTSSEVDSLPAFSILNDEIENGPLKKSIRRIILVDEIPDEFALSRLLKRQYSILEKKVRDRRQSTGQVWIYVYDDRTRVDAGLGEWIGMASAIAQDHRSLTSNPLIQIRLPKKDVDPPTELENRIYSEFVKLLYADDGELPESVVEKRICRKFKISKKRLGEIYFSVRLYRDLIP